MNLNMPKFERAGWARVDITAPAQARIEGEFAAAGVAVETLDVGRYRTAFDEWLRLAEYEGAYRGYAGEAPEALLEKALEHFLSVELAGPASGMTAVDVGSCKSVVPGILRRKYGLRCFEQDLSYPPGVHGDVVGSSADSIPLEDASVDVMTLHCTFEHFEGRADTGFVEECARLLRPSGRVVILPLYLNATHCNVTGYVDAAARVGIGWDDEAEHYCEIPEWQNRFGRHYSVRALMDRVITPAAVAGLAPRVLKVVNWEAIHPGIWLRWILVLDRPAGARAGADCTSAELAALRAAAAAAAARERELGAEIAVLRRQLADHDVMLRGLQEARWSRLGRRLGLL